MDEVLVKARTRSLLEHFAAITDARPQWKVAYPLPEILLLVVSATIASCDDYDDIVAWGEAHLDFLRRFSPYHHGIPCTDWLRVLMNRMDPDLFSTCFMAWAGELRPDAADLIAIKPAPAQAGGKTSRRSHDRSRGKAALHLVSAFATTHNLVLGQEAVADKSCESETIPTLLARLALNGALVTIDAIACNPTIARAITEAGGDYLLAVKGNQPTLQREIERYFVDAPAAQIDIASETEKGHGRIETRRHVVSHTIDWLSGDRRYPDEPRFARLTAIAMVEATVESKGQTSTALLHQFGTPHRPAPCSSSAPALGHRELPPLGPRRHLQGRSVPSACRSRRQKHGRGPPLRHQYRQTRAGQTKHQNPPKTRRLGPQIPRLTPQPQTLLTSTRCPARRCELRSIRCP